MKPGSDIFNHVADQVAAGAKSESELRKSRKLIVRDDGIRCFYVFSQASKHILQTVLGIKPSLVFLFKVWHLISRKTRAGRILPLESSISVRAGEFRATTSLTFFGRGA